MNKLSIPPEAQELFVKLADALNIHTIAGRAVLTVLLENAILMERKQLDYGPGNISAWGINGVGMRLHDKVERIKTLLSHPRRRPQNESLSDSFRDASVYGAIGQVVLNGQWPTMEPLVGAPKPVEKKPKAAKPPFVPIKVDVHNVSQ